MKSIFYLEYAQKTARKNRFRKTFTSVICAAAIAFASVSSGYLSVFLNDQIDYLRRISEREIIVYNNVSLENPYSNENKPIDEGTVNRIASVEGVEKITPLLIFNSVPTGFNLMFLADSLTPEEYEKIYKQQETSTVSYRTSNGKIGEIGFATNQGDNYSVISYSSSEAIEKRTIVCDETINGAYVTEGFVERLGLSKEEMIGGSLSVEVWLTPCVCEDIATVVEEDADGETITYQKKNWYAWNQKSELSFPVRGIVVDTQLPQEGNVFIDCEYLMRANREVSYQEDLARFCDHVDQANGKENTLDFFDWSPCAYYVTVDQADSIPSIVEEFSSIDPNLKSVYYYQDFDAGKQIIENNRMVLLMISGSILTIVFLLTALIYVYLIDRRKFEFAVLRANGLTKREIRKIIYAEMLLQFIVLFLLSLIIAAIIYLIAAKGFGFLFRFDGKTVLYTMLISFGAILLPTVISLLFVNRFEPDAVMRN